MKHLLFDALRDLQPKYPLIQNVYWEQKDGQITGTCPLTALALQDKLIDTDDLLESKVSGHDICVAIERQYNIHDAGCVFVVWDSMHNDLTRTLKHLADTLEEEY